MKRIVSHWLPLAAGVALVLATGFAGAAEPVTSSRSLALDECIQLALEHNLDVKVARYGPELARYDVHLAYARYEPSLSAGTTRGHSSSPGGIDAENRPFPGTVTESDSYRVGIGGGLPIGLSYDLGMSTANTRGTNPGGPFENTSGSVSIQLRQPLLRNLWIDSTRLAILVSRKQLQISELALRQQIMRIVTTTELTYYDLILARESVKVQEQALELARQLLRANRRRVELGLLPALDEKQAESQVAARQASLQAAHRSRITTEYALKELLSDDFTQWEQVTIVPTETLRATPLPFDLHDSWQKGLTLRPDLLQSRINLERQGIVLKYLRNQLFPQLDVVGSYGLRGSRREYSGVFGEISQRDSPFYSVGAVISIPLGNRRARVDYQSARAEREQSLLRLKQLEQSIMVDIGVAVEQARTTLKQLESTREARRFAEIALEAEQKKLETGKSSSFIVLQLQRDLTGARVAELQAMADYNRALANLALREGSTLERHQIGLEMGAE